MTEFVGKITSFGAENIYLESDTSQLAKNCTKMRQMFGEKSLFSMNMDSYGIIIHIVEKSV